MKMNNLIGCVIPTKEPGNAPPATIGDDGLAKCSKCGGNREVEIEIIGEKKIVPCLCKCLKEKRDREQKQKKIDERKSEIARMRQGFSDEFKNNTFENDNGMGGKLKRMLLNYVDKFIMFKRTGNGLILYGGVGTGKTFAANCVANALLNKGFSVFSTSTHSIIDDKIEFSKMRSFSAVLIDDLGSERGTEYAKELVFNAIDFLYRFKIPMIITTNLTASELREPQDADTARYYDRVLERCLPIKVNGKNVRHTKASETYEKMRELLNG